MMYLCLALVLVLRVNSIFGQESPVDETINVKTVLFKDKDCNKNCWTADDIQLLVARKMMQDLVPKKLPSDFQKLSKYIRTVLDTVKCKSPPEIAPRITLAAYDVMGGYLKSIGIPILNEAYYAGNVPYEVAAEIHCIYGRILSNLKTDGSDWAGPIDMCRIPTKVRALNIAVANSTEACNTLEVRTSPESEQGYMADSGSSKICIPYLDDNYYPNAIAVPLKGNSLFSLMSNCSANLLPKFYILAMRCLASNYFTKKDIITFNHQFHDWILSSVVPHIHESDRWYPGFGGVMRIIETMNQRGLAGQDTVRADISPNNNRIPLVDEVDDYSKCFASKNMMLLIILVVVFILICCCSCYCLMKMCLRPPPPDPNDSNEGLAKTLVSIYCGVKDTIVGGKCQPQPTNIKDDAKCSSKTSYNACGPFYSSSEEGDSSCVTTDN